jgi:hypothetical protein
MNPEHHEWRDIRQTLLKTAQEKPGILLDVIDSAYLAGLDARGAKASKNTASTCGSCIAGLAASTAIKTTTHPRRTGATT